MPYRPLRKTPRPFIRGCQTAVVVGPAGEEIYTDEYGRVKVQFHWDREGKYDAKSSCWIRVGTTWAGKNWGAISIPRIGHEVIVDFLEGDPDRPIITGSVYNLDMMPSYPLPGNKTRSGIKTRSTIGGGGFNEIRFEDKKGSEQIFIHGEKDLDIRIKKDSREWIGNNTSLIVKKDKYEEIGSDSHVYIKRDLNEKVGRDHSLNVLGKEAVQITGSKSLKVTGAVADEFGSDHSEKTTGDYYLHAKNIVLEADVQLTISVGGNFVTIGPAGVTIVGTMVMINSGGAAGQGSAGSIVPPSDPKAPDVADDATPGGDKQYSGVGPGATKGIPSITGKGHAASPAPPDAPRHDPSDPANQEKKHYIEIELHDDEQLPVPGEPYEIILPDGSTVASGTTDEKGRARVENIDAGNCRVRFPRRDQTMVKPK
jgi:type VI secretion system secreted protein VgrG